MDSLPFPFSKSLNDYINHFNPLTLQILIGDYHIINICIFEAGGITLIKLLDDEIMDYEVISYSLENSHLILRGYRKE